MSRHISSNYFEEEIDDDAFLRHPTSGSSGFILPQHSQQVMTHFLSQLNIIDFEPFLRQPTIIVSHKYLR